MNFTEKKYQIYFYAADGSHQCYFHKMISQYYEVFNFTYEVYISFFEVSSNSDEGFEYLALNIYISLIKIRIFE